MAAGNLFSNNYAFTYIDGSLTVNKASLTVTADNQSKNQGAPNPALTFTYSGFVLGETAANLTSQPTATTTATDSSPAGIYPITVSGGVSGNYTFTYVPGALTVVSAANPTLSVTTAGTGNGTVNSTPSGIACASGSGNGCSATFTSGTPVTLLATPDWKSLFSGWSGACTGTGSCNVTMNADTSVTATFIVNPLVMLPGPTPSYFATIQDAYIAAADGTIIKLTANTFTEDLVFGRPVSVTLEGGLSTADYTTVTGVTAVHGSLSFTNGTVNVKGISIE